jgi:hypothetical protein
VSIPYEGVSLAGYFCVPDLSGKQRPLLIVHTGYDGTAEELYFTNAVVALIANSTIYDFHAYVTQGLQPQGEKMLDDQAACAKIDFAIRRYMVKDTRFR